jgi:hypothetical protein
MIEHPQRFHAFDFNRAKNVCVDGIYYQRGIHALLVAEILESKYDLPAPAAAAFDLAANAEPGAGLPKSSRMSMYSCNSAERSNTSALIGAVEALVKQRSKLTDFIQQFCGFIRVAQVQDLGATEEVFEIERGGTHGAKVAENFAKDLPGPHPASSLSAAVHEFRRHQALRHWHLFILPLVFLSGIALRVFSSAPKPEGFEIRQQSPLVQQ